MNRESRWRSASALAALLAVSFVLTAPLRAQTKLAISAGPHTEFPAVGQGGFEDPTVTSFAFPPSWTSWTMTGAGITANGSAIAASGPTTNGTHAAFLQGPSSLSTTFTIQPGTWRLRFTGAQRLVGTTEDAQSVRVTIAGKRVFEQVLAPSGPSVLWADYATRPLTFATATSVFVDVRGLVAGHTALIDHVRLEPIAPWNATATWGGAPPTKTNAVRIPPGVEVALIDKCVAAAVVVDGEVLASDRDGSLDCNSVNVTGQAARFEVGHELAPHEQDFTLMLNGAATPGVQSKFLMAMDGGQIDLHGKPALSWTRLDRSAAQGDTVIRVQDAVTWEQGDRIVVAGTNLIRSGFTGYEEDEAEVVYVASVAAGGRDITIGSPLAHPHSGDPIAPFSNGVRTWSLDERAEVGLLSHNVRVQGDPTSESSRWGAHVMLMRGGCCTSGVGGRGRFSNVEFYRVGQLKELGRYPIHFHMQVDQGAGQFVKNCSIYRSFNRAITIHGSEHVVLERNVAYDHMGHGFFLEDGSERFNKLLYNLALGTRRPLPSEAVIPSDHSGQQDQNRSPATYWITNPNNEFIGNVAAGTVGTGFWFALPEHPTGLSANPAFAPYFPGLEPNHEPLGTFEDNVCHSSGSGFDVHDGIDPVTHDIVPNRRWLPNTSAPQFLDHFTAWGCSTGLYAGADQTIGAPGFEQVRFREAVLADNLRSITFADYAVVESSCVVARTAASAQTNPVPPTAYTVYDGPGRVFDSHFVGFNGAGGSSPPGPAMQTFLRHTGAATRSVNHRFRNLSFDPPGPPSMIFDGDPNLNDALLFGAALVFETTPGAFVGTIVPNHPMMRTLVDTAYSAPFAGMWSSPSLPLLSPMKFAHLRIRHDPSFLQGGPPFNALPRVKFTRKLLWHPDVSHLTTNNAIHHRQMSVMVNNPGQAAFVAYDLTWTSVPSPGPVTIEIDDMDPDFIQPGSHLELDLIPFGGVSPLTVTVNGTIKGPVPLAQLASQQATAYAIVGSALRLRIVSSLTSRSQVIVLSY